MTAPWNMTTGALQRPDSSQTSGGSSFLDNWIPSSAHQIEALNQAVDPVSILTDMEMQHELDFFANAQFTFDNVEPLPLARNHKKTEASVMHCEPGNPARGDYQSFASFVSRAQDDVPSYHGPKVMGMLDHHEREPGPNTGFVYAEDQHALPQDDLSPSVSSAIYAQPPVKQPHMLIPQSPQQQRHQQQRHQQQRHQQQQHQQQQQQPWQQHHSMYPENLSTHHPMIASVASTPVTSPLASPLEASWQNTSNYMVPPHSGSVPFDRSPLMQDKESDTESKVLPRQRQQSSSSQTTTTTVDNQRDNDDDRNSTRTPGNGTKLSKEDKRQRNTAASARFRIKKKLREQALQRTAYEMTEKSRRLEAYVRELEQEIKWLKALIVEKNTGRPNHDGSVLG